MNQKKIQLLALFVLKTTLRQCDNLTDDILAKKLEMTTDEVSELIRILYEEHVIRFKYSFICPKCKETDTLEEDEIEKTNYCNLCGNSIDIKKLIKGATIRYMLDRDALWEYMEENLKLSGILEGTVLSSGHYDDRDLQFYEAVKKGLSWVCGKGEK